jgi:hypothetical protein
MPYKRDVIQYFFYFATFSMKENNLKPLKLKDSQGHVCGLPRHHSIRQNKKIKFHYFKFYYYITPFPITIRKTVS